ncbi:hypothetical protein L7F22_066081 [Adiantum nelumboides]|nr:hypothetical protein [Adiantum nelumboides]
MEASSPPPPLSSAPPDCAYSPANAEDVWVRSLPSPLDLNHPLSQTDQVTSSILATLQDDAVASASHNGDHPLPPLHKGSSNIDTTTTTQFKDSLHSTDTTKNSLIYVSTTTSTHVNTNRKPKSWKSLVTLLNPNRNKIACEQISVHGNILCNRNVALTTDNGSNSPNKSIVSCILPKQLHNRKLFVKNSMGKSSKSKPLLPPLSKGDKGKKTLVLDLDETLVHTDFQPLAEYDYVVQIPILENLVNGGMANVYVLHRPGVDEFLQAMSSRYELVVFTASTKSYANAIIDKLDPKRLIKHRLHREFCTFSDGGLVKDLTTLGRDLHRVILLDNTPHCYSLQPLNGLAISSFFNDKEDTELIQLIPFLSLIAELDDVTISLNAIPR